MRYDDIEYHVPDGDTPEATCPHCGAPFRSERARDLHLGDWHGGDLTDEQRAAHETAATAEADELFVFHMKVFGALGVVYGGTTLLYMVALGSGFI